MTEAAPTPKLPTLRRSRRRFTLARAAGLAFRGIAAVNDTIEPRARYWDEHNTSALTEDGPLWVALGDSVTQGIGSSTPETSYVHLVADRLREHTGESWRVINLSMTGGRFDDVINQQLPAIAAASLQPLMVSAIVGSNDVIWRRNASEIIDDARELVDSLPQGALLSRLSEARRDDRRTGVNRVFDAAGAVGHVRLFEAWDWPTGEGMWAEDRFHPNDKAYQALADNTWGAMLARLGAR